MASDVNRGAEEEGVGGVWCSARAVTLPGRTYAAVRPKKAPVLLSANDSDVISEEKNAVLKRDAPGSVVREAARPSAGGPSLRKPEITSDMTMELAGRSILVPVHSTCPRKRSALSDDDLIVATDAMSPRTELTFAAATMKDDTMRETAASVQDMASSDADSVRLGNTSAILTPRPCCKAPGDLEDDGVDVGDTEDV